MRKTIVILFVLLLRAREKAVFAWQRSIGHILYDAKHIIACGERETRKELIVYRTAVNRVRLGELEMKRKIGILSDGEVQEFYSLQSFSRECLETAKKFLSASKAKDDGVIRKLSDGVRSANQDYCRFILVKNDTDSDGQIYP